MEKKLYKAYIYYIIPTFALPKRQNYALLCISLQIYIYNNISYYILKYILRFSVPFRSFDINKVNHTHTHTQYDRLPKTKKYKALLIHIKHTNKKYYTKKKNYQHQLQITKKKSLKIL